MLRATRAIPDRIAAALRCSLIRKINGPPFKPCYLTGEFPAGPAAYADRLRGGAVKLGVLAQAFPHSFPECSLVYRVSSVHHRGAIEVVKAATKRNISVISNQNGVFYPAWFAGDNLALNRNLSELLKRSSFVIYQSSFCRVASEKFLGISGYPSQVVLNPVDTSNFQPRLPKPEEVKRVIILSNWGSGHRSRRTEAALHGCLAAMKALDGIVVRFLGWDKNSAGDRRLREMFETEVKKHALSPEAFEFVAPYSRLKAAEIFAAGDIFLHTVHNDASPNVLGEALASGLPVIFPTTGGCAEIVGDAGVGISVPDSWEQQLFARPEQISEAIYSVVQDLHRFKLLARARAEQHLSAERFIASHELIFNEVLHG